MSIKLGEFDDIESFNMFAIKDIMQRITDTAPEGVKVSWAFPGYVSIVLPNEREIAFGESLELESGYSWNCYELDGTNDACDAFDDLKDIDAIVNKLWQQTSSLLEKSEK
jgi:hypothetical protein